MTFDLEKLIQQVKEQGHTLSAEATAGIVDGINRAVKDPSPMWACTQVCLCNTGETAAIEAAREAIRTNRPAVNGECSMMEDIWILHVCAEQGEKGRTVAVEILDPYEPFDCDSLISAWPLDRAYEHGNPEYRITVCLNQIRPERAEPPAGAGFWASVAGLIQRIRGW